MTDYIPILWRILFLNTNFIDFLNIQCSTTVKNRELGTIYLDKTVVNTHSIKVNSLYLVSGVFWSRIECNGKAQTSVESFAAQGETTL